MKAAPPPGDAPPGPVDDGLGGDHQHPAITDWIVFGISAVVTAAFVIWGMAGTGSLKGVSDAILGWVLTNLGWVFVLASGGFVVFSIWLAVSRYGNIKLGRTDEEPEFKTVSWIAMMFSAGMGIGLMFYGAAEPLNHFASPPPGSEGGIEVAMATSLFHWTVHPWAIYAVVGLVLAYGTYRRGRKQLISSAFEPLLGKKITNGGVGRTIDIFAIFATLFGSACSLGLGVLQIQAGVQQVGWAENPGNLFRILLVVGLTIAFILSAVSGVSKGIQWLSNINMVMAIVLALFVFVVGPVVLIMNMVPTSIGGYFADLFNMSARTASTDPAAGEWLAGNSIFYWAWWMSWTPFVGMFIARISRGRTIRQFVLGVIAVPSVVSVIWFAIFGSAAINKFFGDKPAEALPNVVKQIGDLGEEDALFETLRDFPAFGFTSVLVMALVAIFFVAGADAASLVMGTMSQRGTLSPKTWVVVFWGAMTGAVALIMLLIGGEDALRGLQNITIIAAAPFLVIMVGLCVSLVRDLRTDPLIVTQETLRTEQEDTMYRKLFRPRVSLRKRTQPKQKV